MAAMASQQEQPQGQPQQPQQDPNAQGGDGGSQEMFEAIAEGPLTYIYSEERTQYATMIDEMSQLMEQQSGKPQPSDAEKDDQFDNEEV